MRPRQGRKRKASDEQIASELNRVLQKREFDKKYINALSKLEHLELTQGVRKDLVKSLQLLINDRGFALDITGATPKELEGYGKFLPHCFETQLPASQVEGVKLGDQARLLKGLWQLFFYRPPDDEEGSPAIRGKVALFGEVDQTDLSLPVEVISQHSHWKGFAFATETHIYIAATHVARIDSHFYILNRVRQASPFLFGVGSTVHPPAEVEQPYVRPAECYFVFGARWDETKETNGERRKIGERLLAGEDILAESQFEDDVKTTFCAPTVTFKTERDFARSYPELVRFMRSVRAQGKSMQARSRLKLEWAFP